MTETIGIRVKADASALTSGLSAATATLRAAASQMRGAFASVQPAVAGVAAAMGRFHLLLAGVAASSVGLSLSNAVSQMAALDDAAEQTGASVEGLSSLLNTLAPTGVSLAQITDLAGKMQRAMAGADEETSRAAEAFRLLGVKTKDAAGNFRPVEDVIEDVARALSAYGDGSNKTAIAQAILTKSGAQYLPLLKDLASRSREAATVTSEQAAKAEELSNMIRGLGVQSDILKQRLASALIPSLLSTATAFNQARTAGLGFYDALKAGMGLSALVPFEVQSQIARVAALREKVESPRGLGEVLDVPVNTAKLRQAELYLTELLKRYKDLGRVRDDTDPRAFEPASDPPPAPKLSGSDDGDGGAARRALLARQTSALQGLELQLAKERELSEVEQMRIRTTTGEYKAFSAAVKARLMLMAEEIDKQRTLEAEVKRATEAETEDNRALAVLRQQAIADQRKQADEIERLAENWKDVGDPTRKYLRQIEEIRRLVDSGKLTSRQGFLAEDVVQNQMQDDLTGPLKPPEAKSSEWLGTLEGGFRQFFSAVQQGSVTTRGVFMGALDLMGSTMTNVLAKMSAEWIAAELGWTTAKATQASVRAGIDAGAAATSVATNAGAASTNIMTSAYEAMAGAFKAIVGIPYVGPFLAPAAAAAAFGAVASLVGNLASAEGGFDIPAGVNPIAQLHAREMVLPAEHADTIRRLGASAGGATHNTFIIKAWDSRSVADMIDENAGAFAEAALRARRNGTPAFSDR